MNPQDSQTQVQALKETLELRGYRYTDQRGAVYVYLAGTNTHPTAEDVHLSVRDELPTISLGTVYKSLETLVDCGLAHKLSFSDGSSRYDGRMDPHHHARCVSCGSVQDLPGSLSSAATPPLGRQAGFVVTGYRLELTGYCATCS